MSKKKGKWIPFALLVMGIVILLGVFSYASPYISIWRLGSALEKNDTATVVSYIDVPRFRDSLRSEVKTLISGGLEIIPGAKFTPLGFLGTKLVETSLDYLIETQLTEENIAKILEGQRPSLDPKSDGTSVADGKSSPGGHSGPGENSSSTEDEGTSSSVTTEIVRDSLGSFRVVYKKDGIHLFDLLWEGNGFAGWKVVGIQLFKESEKSAS